MLVRPEGGVFGAILAMTGSYQKSQIITFLHMRPLTRIYPLLYILQCDWSGALSPDLSDVPFDKGMSVSCWKYEL